MKKLVALILAAAMLLLAGCAGTTVVVGDTTTPTESTTTPATNESPEPAPAEPAAEALKTGLAILTDISDSASATAEKEGVAKYDITIAAVTVDDTGVIRACTIDSVPASVKFDTTGTVVSDLTADVPTKNEMGADYGMVAWGGAIAEWDAQVAALAEFAVGKTVDELRNGAIDETGKAPAGSDLASSATIYLGGYVEAIAAAVNNASHLGAQTGDSLRLVTDNSVAKSASATAEKNGTAQLDSTIAVLTIKDAVITSCAIDAVQAKISFDTTGAVTTDLTAAVRTKNEMGADYGMVAWGGAIAEWNEQAAAFAAYVTGKTADEVANIAVTESTKPAEGTDLASSVTISIGDFQALVHKAFQK